MCNKDVKQKTVINEFPAATHVAHNFFRTPDE